MSHYDNYDDLIGLGLINIEMKNFESGLSLFIKKSLLDLTAEFKIAKAGSSGEAVDRIEGLEDGLNNVKKTFLNNFIKPLMGEVSFALMLKESANIYFKMIYKLDDLAKRFKLDDSELTEVQKSENNIYKQYFELNKSNSVNPSKLISELKNIDKEIDDSSVNVESLYKEYAGYFS